MNQSIIIVGLGATGSVAAALVARMHEINRIVLIDPDTYSRTNLVGQAIECSDIGVPKVRAQGTRLAGINPALRIVCLQERIENVPLGVLRDSVILCCTDDRRSRHTINRMAGRLGIRWVDLAVSAPSLLRVTVYCPGAQAPCMECSMDHQSYDLLEQEYPCQVGDQAVPATAAPAELSGLAASLGVVALRKVLSRQAGLSGMQLMLETDSYEQHLMHFRYSPDCRFDHETWSIDAIDMTVAGSTLADLLTSVDAAEDTRLGVDGHRFVTQLDCVDCGYKLDVGLRLHSRLNPDQRRCRCGGRLLATGFASHDTIRRRGLSPEQLEMRLTEVGLREGDVITVGNDSGNLHHLEIKGVQTHA